MVSPAKALEVTAMLRAGGLSQTKIARRVGISRGTVAAILRGEHWSMRDRAPIEERDETPEERFCGPPVRCGCGARIYMPCRACRDRAALAKRPLPRDRGPAIQLGLNLSPAQEQRRRETPTGRLRAAAEKRAAKMGAR